MRSEPRGNFYIDAMSHRHNLTVPGVVGYRPQKSGGGAMPTNPEDTVYPYSGTGGFNSGPGSFNPVEIPGDHH